jgi:hypothetical protein
MSTEHDQHLRYVLFVDLPAHISENDAAEIVGGVDNDLADYYPEGPDGGAYFHQLKLVERDTAKPAPPDAGTCRHRVHLDLFYGADDSPDFLDTVVEQANEALPKYIPADSASPASRFSVADRTSVSLYDPKCFYCNPSIREELHRDLGWD